MIERDQRHHPDILSVYWWIGMAVGMAAGTLIHNWRAVAAAFALSLMLLLYVVYRTAED